MPERNHWREEALRSVFIVNVMVFLGTALLKLSARRREIFFIVTA